MNTVVVAILDKKRIVNWCS